MQWHLQQTHGSRFPVFGKGALSAVVGDHLYIFGGLDDEDYRNGLFRLNLKDYKWESLSSIGSPSARAYGGMVAHGECLVLFGGIGKPPLYPSRLGAEYMKDNQFDEAVDATVWNNSLHEYNTTSGIKSSPLSL